MRGWTASDYATGEFNVCKKKNEEKKGCQWTRVLIKINKANKRIMMMAGGVTMEDEDGEQARLPKYLSQPPDHQTAICRTWTHFSTCIKLSRHL